MPDESYGCNYCHDAGFVRGKAEIVENMWMAKAIPCPKCSPAPESVGIPDALLGKTWADFDPAINPGMGKALERVRDVAAGREWCALLAGRPGLGKSLLACCALHDRYGHFWEWGALLRNIRELAFGENGPHHAEEDVLRAWQTGEFLLVLDDVGAEKMSEWAVSTLYTILSARESKRLPTIITTNNPGSIDERVLSRYSKGIVDCKGSDVRRR